MEKEKEGYFVLVFECGLSLRRDKFGGTKATHLQISKSLHWDQARGGIVGHNLANSYRASFNLKFKRLHLFKLNSHVDLEFLREITRSTVSRNGSKFEPVNISSLKVIELERSSLSSSNISGASESVRVVGRRGSQVTHY